jgi:hypothetical protein
MIHLQSPNAVRKAFELPRDTGSVSTLAVPASPKFDRATSSMSCLHERFGKGIEPLGKCNFGSDRSATVAT